MPEQVETWPLIMFTLEPYASLWSWTEQIQLHSHAELLEYLRTLTFSSTFLHLYFFSLKLYGFSAVLLILPVMFQILAYECLQVDVIQFISISLQLWHTNLTILTTLSLRGREIIPQSCGRSSSNRMFCAVERLWIICYYRSIKRKPILCFLTLKESHSILTVHEKDASLTLHSRKDQLSKPA